MFDVLIYDDRGQPISSPRIEMLELNRWGVKIDIKTNGQLGPSEYGASLNSPAPPEPVNVWVDDTAGDYAPANLGPLNTESPFRLPVALYPLPRMDVGGADGRLILGSPEAGPGPVGHKGAAGRRFGFPAFGDTNGTIATKIADNHSTGKWSEREAFGVKHLVSLVTRATEYQTNDPDFRQRLNRWCLQLQLLGITIPGWRLTELDEPYLHLLFRPLFRSRTTIREETPESGAGV